MSKMSHQIPHRFQPYTPPKGHRNQILAMFGAGSKTPETKQLCQECNQHTDPEAPIGGKQQAQWQKCQDCDFVCHSSCVKKCRPTCGLTPAMTKVMAKMNVTPIKMPTAQKASQKFNKHHFVPRQFVTQTDCIVCNESIWGGNKSGCKCYSCGACIHQKCQEKIMHDLASNGAEAYHWKCDPKEMMRDVLSPLTVDGEALDVDEMDFNSRRNSLEEAFQSTSIKNEEDTAGDLGTSHWTTLGRARRTLNGQSFISSTTISGVADTLMRLKRNKYDHPQFDGVLQSPQRAPPSPSVAHPEIDAGTMHSQFHRKIHPFRGHEYRATYLQSTRSTDDGSIIKHFSCQHCNEALADDGRQCYQCKLCSYYCHKKCYILTKPCSVSVASLDSKVSPEDLLREREIAAKQVGVIHYRNSMIVSEPQHWSEDFSDELVKDSKIFTTLDDYKIEEAVLGSGQYGIVKKGAYKHNPSFQVAVKIIDKRKLWDPARNKKAPASAKQQSAIGAIPTILQRELDILQKLDHPDVIKMHNFFDSDRNTYIIMDLANSGDLLDYIMKRQKVKEHEVRNVIAPQILSALKYLHDRGVTHRDLKPENLLLSYDQDKRMQIKIADFGFATIFDTVATAATGGDIGVKNAHKSIIMMQSVVGTQAYMAPEIVDQRVWKYCADEGDATPIKGYDKSVDMWSLGVILYVCLGGVFPFDSQQPILDQIIRGEFFFPDDFFHDVSDEAVDLICNLLVVNPRKRFDCKKSLSHAWLMSVI